MAINTLETATILQQELDQKAVEDLTSGWMDENAGQVKYNGGKEIKIPNISTSGMKNYDPDEGFKKGAVTLTYQTQTMSMDRGTTFHLDSQEVDETNFTATAANTASVFQKESVIPEIEAYRYSKVAALAKLSSIYVPSAETILSKLLYDIARVQDVVGEKEPLVITMNRLVKSQLEELDKFLKMVSVAEFVTGAVKTKVREINDIPIISVGSTFMKTAYVFKDGETEGQKDGGFEIGSSAIDINWIIAPRRAPIAVTKQDKIRIFEPDTNQTADAWKVDYRRYHDLWMKETMKNATCVNKKA